MIVEGWLSGVSGMSRQCLRPRSSGTVACPLPWQQACVSAHRNGDTIGKEVRTMEGILLCAGAVVVLVGLGALVEKPPAPSAVGASEGRSIPQHLGKPGSKLGTGKDRSQFSGQHREHP